MRGDNQKFNEFVINDTGNFGNGSSVVVDVINPCSRIKFPAVHNGRKVTKIHIFTKMSGVKHIRIPASVTQLEFKNESFPDLEIVEIDAANKKFFAKDGMIFKRLSNGGIALVNVFCGNKKDKVVIPEFVTLISDQAFSYTTCKEIEVMGELKGVHVGAFRNSRWYDLQPALVTIGGFLYSVKKWYNSDALVIDDTIKSLVPCHEVDSVRKVIIRSSRLPDGFADFIQSRNIYMVDVDTNVTEEMIEALKSLGSSVVVDFVRQSSHVVIRNNVIFSNDRTRIIWYADRTKSDYTVPDCVKKINDFAFAWSKLKTINLGNGVEEIGIGAFYSCASLKNVFMSSRVRELPDAKIIYSKGTKNGVGLSSMSGVQEAFGVFSKCGRLNIDFLNGIKKIGSYAFCECAIRKLVLPDSVEYVGKRALTEIGCQSPYRACSETMVVIKGLNVVLEPEAILGVVQVKFNDGEVSGVIPALFGKDSLGKQFEVPSDVEIGFLDNVLPNTFCNACVMANSNRTVLDVMDKAFGSGKLNYNVYSRVFNHVKKQDRLRFAAIFSVAVNKDTPSTIADYLCRNADRIATEYIRHPYEEQLLHLIENWDLSDDVIDEILGVADSEKFTRLTVAVLEKYRKDTDSVDVLTI